jgi:N-acetylglutamate synthase
MARERRSVMDTTIEELSLSGWPALQTELYDGWVLRFAEGYTKRSNSVNALYPGSGLFCLGEKIGSCEEAYAARGLPTVFKILSFSEHAELDAKLEGRGYERLDETVVRTLELGEKPWRAARARVAPDEAVASIEGGFSPAWIDGYCSCSGNAEKRDLIAALLANAPPKTAAACVRQGGEIVACGYSPIERLWAGFYDIVVQRELRGQGLGEAIMRALLEAAIDSGARRAYLQVVAGNAPAERLYDKLGFREEYRYWYRRTITSPASSR